MDILDGMNWCHEALLYETNNFKKKIFLEEKNPKNKPNSPFTSHMSTRIK